MATPGNADPMQVQGLRREPRQERSRAKVRRVLEAADRVLSGDGFEALTVRRIAEEAAVPVGTIYQFFPDKNAIVDALAHRYIDEFATAMAELVDRAERERWDDPVATLLDSFIALYQSRPGYLTIWTGRHLSPELLRADEENNAAIADGVRRVLVAQLDLPDGPDLERACRVAVQVSDALLQYAFRDALRTGAGADADVLAELVRLQRLYLADLVERRKSPTGRPTDAFPHPR